MIRPFDSAGVREARRPNRARPRHASWALGLAFAAVISPAAAQSDPECDHLWERRNSIYAAAGYCFKTDRAIAHFGNIGCQYDREQDVPLTRQERREIQAIIRQEKVLGCRL